jgi:hypothetical protein
MVLVPTTRPNNADSVILGRFTFHVSTMNLSWDYLRQSTAALEQHYHAGLAGGGGVPPTSSVLLNASSLLDANVAINNVSNSIATTTTTTNVSNNSEANVAQPGDDLSWIKREEMRLSTNGQK